MKGKYDTSIQMNFSMKNLKEIMIAKKSSKATKENLYHCAESQKTTKVKKMKLKWKTIKWLIENKKGSDNHSILGNLDILIKKKAAISSMFKDGKGLNLKEFTRVMKVNGVSNEAEFINKLFWIFDENDSGDIEYKELAFGLEMFRESNFDSKLKGKLLIL